MSFSKTTNKVDEHYRTYAHLDTDSLRKLIEQHIDELERRETFHPLNQIKDMSHSISNRLQAAIKVYLDRTEFE
ncbi:hypothetical protein AB3N04_00095 (plasmid) [Alkalihalophilus sp. As8PL]|uniref:Uncharacterized protein n=1 Tax=Alkalihalophilus sp. As8PL TaxID=3237103 RepID=A0AB39BMY3_9BACI